MNLSISRTAHYVCVKTKAPTTLRHSFLAPSSFHKYQNINNITAVITGSSVAPAVMEKARADHLSLQLCSAWIKFNVSHIMSSLDGSSSSRYFRLAEDTVYLTEIFVWGRKNLPKENKCLSLNIDKYGKTFQFISGVLLYLEGTKKEPDYI